MSVQALSCAMAIRGVSASEKLLLLVLANYADEHMRSFPSHSRLSGDTGLSERTILTLMKGLEARLMLSRKERRRPDGSRSSDIITLHFGGEVISPRGEDVASGVGKSTTGGGEMVSPLTTFEPSLEEPSLEEPQDRAIARRAPAGFAAFWLAYPEKVGKRAALTAYDRAIRRLSGADPPGVILAGVERAKLSRKWREGKIPNPATWLNQDRWEDQPAEPHDRPDHDPRHTRRQANYAAADAGFDAVAGRVWKP